MFRILSIDGGGIKGVFPASFLAQLEKLLPHPIASYFDLIAGTSTGGIIALGLGLGLSASELLAFYEEHGPAIFERPGKPGLFGWRYALDGLRKAKYDTARLQRAVESVFKDKKLGDSSTRLLIPAFNLSVPEIHVYKTAHHPRLKFDYRVSAVDVAMSTSAAPTFFAPYGSTMNVPFVDGGLWANNPVGFAVVEAISLMEVSRSDIHVLSLGCTEEAVDLTLIGSGQWHWRRAIDVALYGQSFGSMGIAYTLLGHERVIRLSPKVPRGRFALDGIQSIADLKGLGYSEARHALPQLENVFFGSQTKPFVPCAFAEAASGQERPERMTASGFTRATGVLA